MASNACKKGQVQVNGQSVKPSREILPLDEIRVRRDQHWREFQVLDIPKSRMGAKLVGLYCLEITPSETLEKEDLKRMTAVVTRDQGSGRPTKKERREIDEIELDENFED